MKQFIVSLLAVLSCGTAFGHGYVIEGDLSNYGLLKSVEICEFVALGRVELLTPQYREDIHIDGSDMICTDVMFRIETLIKGTPNFGDDYMKFIFEGGTAYHPGAGRVVTQGAIPEVSFEVGERVLLFLRNDDDPSFANYPYGQHRVHMCDYGKKLVVDNKVDFLYKKTDESVIPVELNVDLAKTLSLSFMEDKEGAKAIEQSIKSLATQSTDKVTLTDALTERLKTNAKKIIDRAKRKNSSSAVKCGVVKSVVMRGKPCHTSTWSISERSSINTGFRACHRYMTFFGVHTISTAILDI